MSSKQGGAGAGVLLVVLVVALPIVIVAAILGTVIDPDCSSDDSAAAGSVGTAGQKVWPMKKGTYQLTSPFGPRGGSMHQGQDFGSTAGVAIYATDDGVVSKAGAASGFGDWIVLTHNINGQRVDTVYGHMFERDLMVTVGQKVIAGQQIARVGYNGQVDPPGPGGAHLHFEVWPGGWGTAPVDPIRWLTDAREPGGGGTPSPGAGMPPPDSAVVTVADWTRVASRESGGNWQINTGNGYFGGLQFSSSTWEAFGGKQYAPRADLATPGQQMEVANATLAGQGWDAWPVTSRATGVRDKKPAPRGSFARAAAPTASPGVPAPSPPSAGSSNSGEGGGTVDVSAPMPARLGSEVHWQTNTVRLARAVAQRFPQLRTIGGWRAHDYFPDHPSGAAADIMMPHDGKTADDIALGTRIQRYVMANKDVFHVKYTIWRQYYQPAHGAGNVMEDRGGWTANHMDHVHVTLDDSPRYAGANLGTVRDRASADLGSGSGAGECEQDRGSINAGNVKSGKVPAGWAIWYNRAGRICPQITPSLLASQGYAESGFNPHALSSAGAGGPAQFMPGTWATYGRDYDHDGRIDVNSPGDAIMAQGHYMCAIATQVDRWVAAGQADPRSGPTGDVRDLYLGAYNAGEGAVQSSHGFPDQVPDHFTQTRPYAEKIMRAEPSYRGQVETATGAAMAAGTTGTEAMP